MPLIADTARIQYEWMRGAWRIARWRGFRRDEARLGIGRKESAVAERSEPTAKNAISGNQIQNDRSAKK